MPRALTPDEKAAWDEHLSGQIDRTALLQRLQEIQVDTGPRVEPSLRSGQPEEPVPGGTIPVFTEPGVNPLLGSVTTPLKMGYEALAGPPEAPPGAPSSMRPLSTAEQTARKAAELSGFLEGVFQDVDPMAAYYRLRTGRPMQEYGKGTGYEFKPFSERVVGAHERKVKELERKAKDPFTRTAPADWAENVRGISSIGEWVFGSPTMARRGETVEQRGEKAAQVGRGVVPGAVASLTARAAVGPETAMKAEPVSTLAEAIPAGVTVKRLGTAARRGAKASRGAMRAAERGITSPGAPLRETVVSRRSGGVSVDPVPTVGTRVGSVAATVTEPIGKTLDAIAGGNRFLRQKFVAMLPEAMREFGAGTKRLLDDPTVSVRPDVTEATQYLRREVEAKGLGMEQALQRSPLATGGPGVPPPEPPPLAPPVQPGPGAGAPKPRKLRKRKTEPEPPDVIELPPPAGATVGGELGVVSGRSGGMAWDLEPVKRGQPLAPVRPKEQVPPDVGPQVRPEIGPELEGTVPLPKGGKLPMEVSGRESLPRKVPAEKPRHREHPEIMVKVRHTAEGGKKGLTERPGAESVIPGIALVRWRDKWVPVHKKSGWHLGKGGVQRTLFDSVDDANEALKYAQDRTELAFIAGVVKGRHRPGAPKEMQRSNPLNWDAISGRRFNNYKAGLKPGHIDERRMKAWDEGMDQWVAADRAGTREELMRPPAVPSEHLPNIESFDQVEWQPAIDELAKKLGGNEAYALRVAQEAAEDGLLATEVLERARHVTTPPQRPASRRAPQVETERAPWLGTDVATGQQAKRRGPQRRVEHGGPQPEPDVDRYAREVYESVALQIRKEPYDVYPKKQPKRPKAAQTKAAPPRPVGSGRPEPTGPFLALPHRVEVKRKVYTSTGHVADEAGASVFVSRQVIPDAAIKPALDQARRMFKGHVDEAVAEVRRIAERATSLDMPWILRSKTLRRDVARAIKKDHPDMDSAVINRVLDRMAKDGHVATIGEVDLGPYVRATALKSTTYRKRVQAESVQIAAQELGNRLRRQQIERWTKDELAKRINKPSDVPPRIIEISRSDIKKYGKGDEAFEAYTSRLEAEGKLSRWSLRQLRRRYKRASDETAQYLGINEHRHVWVPRDLDSPLKWFQRNRNMLTDPTWPYMIARAAKANITARRLTTHAGNAGANVSYAILESGDALTPAKWITDGVEHLLWKHGKDVGDLNARGWAALERTGALQTHDVAANLGAYERTGLGSQAFAAAKNQLPVRVVSGMNRGLEKGYAAGDNIPRKSDFKRGWKKRNKVAEMHEPGDILELEVHQGKWVRLGRRDDGWVMEGKGKVSQSQVDDALAEAAVHSSRQWLFDYNDRNIMASAISHMTSGAGTRVGGLAALLAPMSPVYTWFSKAFDIPGIHKGLLWRLFSDGPGIRSTSARVNLWMAGQSAKKVGRMGLLISELKLADRATRGDDFDLLSMLDRWPQDIGLRTIRMSSHPGWAIESGWENANMLAPQMIYPILLGYGRAHLPDWLGSETDWDVLYPVMSTADKRSYYQFEADMQGLTGRKRRRFIKRKAKAFRVGHSLDGLTDGQRKSVIAHRELFEQYIMGNGAPEKVFLDIVGASGGYVASELVKFGDKPMSDVLRRMNQLLLGGIPATGVNAVLGEIGVPVTPSKRKRDHLMKWGSTGTAQDEFFKTQVMVEDVWGRGWAPVQYFEKGRGTRPMDAFNSFMGRVDRKARDGLYRPLLDGTMHLLGHARRLENEGDLAGADRVRVVVFGDAGDAEVLERLMLRVRREDNPERADKIWKEISKRGGNGILGKVAHVKAAVSAVKDKWRRKFRALYEKHSLHLEAGGKP